MELLRTVDPKEYYKILNGPHNSEEKVPTSDEFLNYFKELNYGEPN